MQNYVAVLVNINNLTTIDDEAVGTELIKNASNLVFEHGILYILSCKPGYHLYNSQGYSEIYGNLYAFCIPDDEPSEEEPVTTISVSSTEPEVEPENSIVFTNIDNFLNEHRSIFYSSSVWKNEKGKFNTARLISDSVAVVVLGTVGGVITSKIITKNQIKDSFETLKCTIGGQDIANYGDEFTINVK